MIILINIVIVFMNAFFVATEFAMVKVRKSRVETLAAEGTVYSGIIFEIYYCII